MKAKYQDNLEFCQWIKRYFDLNYSGEPYNALQRRKGQDIFYIMGGNKVAPPRKNAAGGAAVGKTYVGKPGAAANGGGSKMEIDQEGALVACEAYCELCLRRNDLSVVVPCGGKN